MFTLHLDSKIVQSARGLTALLVAALAVTSCGGDGDGGGGTGPVGTATVASVEVSPALATLTAPGATLQLVAVGNDAGGNPIPGVAFTWSSSDILVASVDAATGLATAVGSGTTTLMASANGITGSGSLTVNLTGTGTGSMKVIADVVANDIGSGLYITEFEVTLTDAFAAPVSGGTVTVTNGTVITTLAEVVALSGIYTASAFDFAGGNYKLDVVAGAHNVNDVVVRGPGIHTITGPILNSVHPADQDLTVTWSAGATQAQTARVETNDFASGVLLDNGSFMILGADNPAEPAQAVLVLRSNQVTIAGGLLGSRLQIEIEAEIDPVVIELPPSVTTASPMPAGTATTAYSEMLAAIDGDGTYTWAMFNGTTPPAGLTLNAATGEISGTPTTAGTTNFDIQVTSNTQTANKALAITIN